MLIVPSGTQVTICVTVLYIGLRIKLLQYNFSGYSSSLTLIHYIVILYPFQKACV